MSQRNHARCALARGGWLGLHHDLLGRCSQRRYRSPERRIRGQHTKIAIADGCVAVAPGRHPLCAGGPWQRAVGRSTSAAAPGRDGRVPKYTHPRLADIRRGGVVVALAVELTGTGQLKPNLEVLGDGLVQQSPLGL
jgi:hypothetical protein